MLANDWRNYDMMGDYISHHGVLGQKWGVRRFQDKNGRLTAEGRKRVSETYSNGIKKPKGKLVEGELDSLNSVPYGYTTLTESGKKFKRDVENHIGDYFNKLPKEELKKMRDVHKELNRLNTEWVGGDENTFTDEDLNKLKELDKEWNSLESKYKQECMGDMTKDSWSGKGNDSIASLIADHTWDVKSKAIFEGDDPSTSPFANNSGYPEYEVKHSDSSDEIYHALFGVDDAIMDHLEHHGILGMKWGIRRFQNPDGTRTPAGKARYNEDGEKSEKNPIQKISDTIKKSKTDKQRKAALEKAREAKRKKAAEAKAKEEHEAGKQKALESGDYKEIQKYAHEVSTKELQDALTRADTLSRLNQAVDKTTPKEKDIWPTIDDVANKVGTATNAFNKGKDAWNAFAKAANTFMDEDSMLPEIGTNFAEQKEKKRKEREENERKNKIEEITKSLDPEKIMKNQDLFNDKELSSALARYSTYDKLKKAKEDAATEKAEKERTSTKEYQLQQDTEKMRQANVEAMTRRADAKEIYSNISSFTDSELSTALKRLSDVNSMKEKAEIKEATKDVEKAVENIVERVQKSTGKKTDWFDSYDFPDDDNGAVAKKAVTDVFAYLNSNTDSRYSAPPAWQSILQSSLDEYE